MKEEDEGFRNREAQENFHCSGECPILVGRELHRKVLVEEGGVSKEEKHTFLGLLAKMKCTLFHYRSGVLRQNSCMVENWQGKSSITYTEHESVDSKRHFR